MSLQAARLYATVSVQGAAAAKAALGGVSDSINTTQGTLHKLGGAVSSGLGTAVRNIERLAVVGATAGVGIGVSAVKMATDFQQQMEMIHTQAGASQAEVGSMSKAVLNLSTQTGTSANDLAAALFHLESAGFRESTAVNAMRIAAEGAKVGNANLVDVTNALDAVLVAGGKDAQNLSGSMGELNAIVGAGDMTMQNLADAMGTGILASAHSFGLSLQDVGAALAVFGDNNIRGGQAAVYLRQAIVGMGAPSKAAQKALKSLGLGSLDLANTMRNKGLTAALMQLQDALTKSGLTASQQAAAISAAFGGKKSGTGVLILLEQLQRLQNKEKVIGDSATTFGKDWTATTQTVAFQWSQFVTDLQTAGIMLGSALLPGVTKALEGLTTVISQNQSKLQGFADTLGKGFTSFVGDLEKVNWNQVATVFGRVADGVKSIIDAFLTAPNWVKEVMIGGFALNKLTGGMVTNIAGITASGLAGTVKNLLAGALSKVPKVGGILGSIGATRVYVTNWPAGLGLGGLGKVAGAAGGAAEGGVALGASGIAAIGAAFVAILGSPFYLSWAAQHHILGSQPGTPAQRGGLGTNGAPGQPGYVPPGASGPAGGIPGLLPVAIGEHSQLGQNLIDSINTADRVNAAKQDMLGLDIRNVAPAVSGALAVHIDHAANLARLDEQKLLSQVGKIDPKQALADMNAILKVYTSGTAKDLHAIPANVGLLSQMANRLDKVGDHADAAKIRAGITTLMNQVVSKDEGILEKGSLTASQITQVKSDIAFIKDHGDRTAAAKLQAILDKKASVNVNLLSQTTINVDGRNVAHVIHRWQAPFPTYGPTGSAF